MAVRINDTAPDFTATTTEGTIEFHDWIGDGYALLFSHPKDFTPVCTTELGTVAGMKDDFAARNTKLIGISGDDVIVVPSVSDDDARARHGDFTAPVPYLRYVKQPG